MKIKALELLQAVEAVNSMLQDKMPLRAASWLVLLSKGLQPSYALVVERRNDIIRKYCAKGKNQVAQGKIPDYLKEVTPFLEEEVEVDVLKCSPSIFDTASISPSALLALDPFFEVA